MRTIGAFTVGAILMLLVLAAAACWFVGPPPDETAKLWILPADLAGRKASFAELLAERPAQAVLGVDAAPTVAGSVAVTQPETRCALTPLPWPQTRGWLQPGQNEPAFPFSNSFARCTAGKEFLVYWNTQRSVNVPGRTAPTNAVVLVSLRSRELPLALDSIGMPDCWLQANPDLVLGPTEPVIADNRVQFAVVRTSSQLVLWWTPPRELVGLTLYAQCICEEPGVNTAGLLVSPLVTFTIGN